MYQTPVSGERPNQTASVHDTPVRPEPSSAQVAVVPQPTSTIS